MAIFKLSSILKNESASGTFNCIFENNSLKGLFRQNMKKLKISQLAPDFRYLQKLALKTPESIRKLNNFNFQWTKTLYQNNLKHIAFFFTFFESYGCNLLSVITLKTISYGSPRKEISNFTK